MRYRYRNFNPFSKGKIFLEYSGFPPDITFLCHIFIKKILVVSYVNFAAIFTHYLVQNCLQIVLLRDVRIDDWYVNNDIGICCTFTLESSTHKPLDRCFEVQHKLISFSILLRMNTFPPKLPISSHWRVYAKMVFAHFYITLHIFMLLFQAKLLMTF